MPHVTMITLGVEDLARATAFYTALGWERSGASVEGEVTFFHGSTAVLGLYGREALAADAGLAPDALGATAAMSIAMNLPSREAVDDAIDVAANAGAEVAKPATPTEWGGYSGYFRDADGHLWEVAHNPFFPLRDDGGVTLPE